MEFFLGPPSALAPVAEPRLPESFFSLFLLLGVSGFGGDFFFVLFAFWDFGLGGGLGFGVSGLGFRVWGLGFRVQGLGFGVWGLGFRVSGLGFRV